MSNILKDAIPVDKYKGLFVKNTVGLKCKKFMDKDHKYFNDERSIQFIMRTTTPKDVRQKLTPINLIGRKVSSAITTADDERSEIIQELKEGIDRNKSTLGESLISIDDLWKMFTRAKLADNEMSQQYVKTNTYFFNKHMKTLFMPFKTRPSSVTYNIKSIDLKSKIEKLDAVTEVIDIPILDVKTDLKVYDVPKFIDIRKITPEMLDNKLYKLKTGSYTRIRKFNKNQRYVETIPYKPATAHQFLKVFTSMFEYAVNKKMIEINPMSGLKAPRYVNERNFEVSPEKEKELYKVLMTYPEEKFRAIFMFLLDGRRKNEILTLDWNDVKLETGDYVIRHYNNKNRKEYNYKLPAHIKNLLEGMVSAKGRKGLIFKSDLTGEKIDNFDKRWNTIMRSLELTNITRHDIRRWVGNTAINRGKTTSEIAYMLGHSDDRTVKRYTQVRAETAAEVTADFHESFKSKE